jgi:hypothetical protein
MAYRTMGFLFGVGLVAMAVLIAAGKIAVRVNGGETDNLLVRLLFVLLAGGMGLGIAAGSALGDGERADVGQRARARRARALAAIEMVGWGALALGMAAFLALVVVGVVVQIWRLVSGVVGPPPPQ